MLRKQAADGPRGPRRADWILLGGYAVLRPICGLVGSGAPQEEASIIEFRPIFALIAQILTIKSITICSQYYRLVHSIDF